MSKSLEVKILKASELRPRRRAWLRSVRLDHDRATQVVDTRLDVTWGCGNLHNYNLGAVFRGVLVFLRHMKAVHYVLSTNIRKSQKHRAGKQQKKYQTDKHRSVTPE